MPCLSIVPDDSATTQVRLLPPPLFNSWDGDLSKAGYKRIHGWPCLCMWQQPVITPEKWAAYRKHVNQRTRNHGEYRPQYMLPEWGNQRYAYGPFCREIIPADSKAAVSKAVA